MSCTHLLKLRSILGKFSSYFISSSVIDKFSLTPRSEREEVRVTVPDGYDLKGLELDTEDGWSMLLEVGPTMPAEPLIETHDRAFCAVVPADEIELEYDIV